MSVWYEGHARSASRSSQLIQTASIRSLIHGGILFFICVLPGCLSGPQTPTYGVSESDLLGGYCSSSASLEPIAFSPSPSSKNRESSARPANEVLSPQSEVISRIMGITELIQEIHTLKREEAQNIEGARERWLEARQQLSDFLLMTTLEISSVTAEADCEQTRTQHVATALTEALVKRVERQTLIAILGDAMIGVVAGGLSLGLLDTASAVAAIFGGLVTTGFGLAASFDGSEEQFQHERNLLRDIWEGSEESDLFPASVWAFLNAPSGEKGEGETTRREQLIADWRKHNWLGEPQSEIEERRVELFFGKGGTYGIEELNSRAQMLGLLKTYVGLMNQHLNKLIREVVRSRQMT